MRKSDHSLHQMAGLSGGTDKQGSEEAVHSLKVGGGPEIPLGVDEHRGKG